MGTASDPPLIQVRGISKSYPSSRGPLEVLRDLSLSVDAGTFVAIVGPSGCGKSTFLRIVAGLMRATAGEVLLDGRSVVGPSRRQGMVFQSYTSVPWRTVRQNIEFGLELREIPPDERRRVSQHFIDLMDLAGFEDAYPHTLSGGMRQRVAIARTLANDPDVLLMDEPFGALDYQTRWEMQEPLVTIWEHSRKTVLFVTHDIEEAVLLADRIVLVTARPGHVKLIVDVPFERPRRMELKAAPSFVSLKTDVVQLIREETTAHGGSQRGEAVPA